MLATFRVGDGERFTEEQRGNAILKRYAAYYMPEEMQNILEKTGFVHVEYEIDHIKTGDWMRFLARKS